MQAQANQVSTQAITQTQSLAAVQLLLRAGLSCITFLRNLLPEENFTESHLTTADDSIATSSSEADPPADRVRNHKVNSFRIMTMMRGYTDEADRILNYLENGIFDALGKQYLRSFIFAIYLDSKDPKNIVEAYTFNFKYHKLPGTNVVTPIMTLGDDLQGMSLGGRSRRPNDPVSEAIHKGRLPTLREVKKSVKTMMKTLIQAITNMDELPRRRFATFKLFYNDSTPEDYEPPHFQTGDPEKDKWFFMTHNLDEVPDKFGVGKINCGYHSVNLKVTSIATYLPLSRENDNALFTGTVNKCALAGPPSTEDPAAFAKQAEEQEEDARSRNLVWSADADLDLDDADAEGEDDEDYIRLPDGSYQKVGCMNDPDPSGPIGFRNGNGEIEKVAVSANGTVEAHFEGFKEPVITRLQEVNAKQTPEISPYEETQVLNESQTCHHKDKAEGTSQFKSVLNVVGERKPMVPSPLPPSNLAMDLDSPMSSAPSTPTPSFPQTPVRRKRQHLPHIEEDEEMLDPETQPLDLDTQIADSIKSFSLNDEAAASSIIRPPNDSPTTPKAVQTKDVGLDCGCGSKTEGQMCFCEAGCGRWYHIWCMGYHSARDPRLPDKFICFDCRLKADVSWELIKDDIYPVIMEKYRDFVTYRRAIKIFENSDTLTLAEFSKALDGDSNIARQYTQRLEEDEFIVQVTTTFDGFGLATETRMTKSKKAKDKKLKQRKNFQRIRYAFNKKCKREQKYLEYFTPKQEVESRLLGLDDLRNFRTPTMISVGHVSETIDETQTADLSQELPDVHVKRASVGRPFDHDTDRPSKRLKISVATGIDLAE